MSDRHKMINWWNNLSFEHKFYKVIEWLKSQNRDTTERHPLELTGEEVKEIWNIELNKTK